MNIPQTVGNVSPVRACALVGTFKGPIEYSWRSHVVVSTQSAASFGRPKQKRNSGKTNSPEPQIPAYAFLTLTYPGFSSGIGMSSMRMSLLPWKRRARILINAVACLFLLYAQERCLSIFLKSSISSCEKAPFTFCLSSPPRASMYSSKSPRQPRQNPPLILKVNYITCRSLQLSPPSPFPKSRWFAFPISVIIGSLVLRDGVEREQSSLRLRLSHPLPRHL